MTRTLRIGIAGPDDMKARTMRIARGEEKPGPGDPTVWFPSIESFARILSATNRAMLCIIAEREPGSIEELAEMTGRAKSNLSRTMKTMIDYGIVRMERSGRKLAPKLNYDCVSLELRIAQPRTGVAAPEGDRP
ncbi:HVO_A0114 family putative DNA-binding protein [Xanthobacter autotrophicus]|uniref:HVO_A0114 family putative DNA-binding protein n=1 Tax=Xanthobacter autotrophicus TaxID=280 RepID=UPI00372B528C